MYDSGYAVLSDLSEEEQRRAVEVMQIIDKEISARKLNAFVDVNRVRDFVVCDRIFGELFLSHTTTKIEVTPFDGIAGAGVIRITCKGFTVEEPKKFIDALNLASNYEIYPRTDKKIMVAVTFYGMWEKGGFIK